MTSRAKTHRVRADRLTAVILLTTALALCAACSSDTEEPLIPLTSRPLAPYSQPSVEDTGGPILVVSPHPDDETWAMSYGILEAVAAGREVHGLLLTDGDASFVFEAWYSEHVELHEDSNGDGIVGDELDFAYGRRMEYVRAMSVLGVEEEDLVFAGLADGDGSGLADGRLRAHQAIDAIDSALRQTGATEVWTVTRYTDGDPAGTGDARYSPDHNATAYSARKLADRYGLSARFYKVYATSLSGAHLVRAEHVEHDPLLRAAKMAAVGEYADFDPDSGRLGLGSRSSVLFFGDLVLDPRESWTSLQRLDW